MFAINILQEQLLTFPKFSKTAKKLRTEINASNAITLGKLPQKENKID